MPLACASRKRLHHGRPDLQQALYLQACEGPVTELMQSDIVLQGLPEGAGGVDHLGMHQLADMAVTWNGHHAEPAHAHFKSGTQAYHPPGTGEP